MQGGKLWSGVNEASEMSEGDTAPPQPQLGQPWEDDGAGRRRNQGIAVGEMQSPEGLRRQGLKAELAQI